MTPLITIIIPLKNEAENIRPCLDAIFSQETEHPFEVIVIDSGSTDGTLEILKEYDVRFYSIKPEEFGHGKTRQFGVSLAKGKFVVFTVADAEARDKNWISTLLKPLLSDNKIVASYGIQLVKSGPEHDPVARGMQLKQLNRKPFQFLEQNQKFEDLTPAERRIVCNFDNCTSCIRKNVLKKLPLPDVSYAEDFLWCKSAIIAGYKIAFVPDAAVYHYHTQGVKYVFKRSCYDQILSGKVFEINYCKTPFKLICMCLYAIKESCRILKDEPIGIVAKTRWFFYNFKVESVRSYGFFIGSLANSRYGKRHKLLRKITEKTRTRIVESMETKSLIHD